MQVQEIKDKQLWNAFVGSHQVSQFLQSWEWGEFQKSLGRKIWRLAVVENDKILAGTLLIKQGWSFSLGKSYLYCPRGPVFDKRTQEQENTRTIFEFLLKVVEEIAKKEKAIFLRFEPNDELSLPAQTGVKGYEFKRAKSVQPADTLILDLEKSEEQLLKEMDIRTRYNVNLSKRHGVEIDEALMDTIEKRKESLNIFWELLSKTVKRDKFSSHPKEYYLKIFNQFSADSNLKVNLYLAKYQGKVLAASIIYFFADTAAYTHGASSNEYREVKAPNLLQWEIIRKAKHLGYKYYDFWGIAPSSIRRGGTAGRSGRVQEHRWDGFTKFKKGFGGREVNYPGTWDLVYNKAWYKLYNFLRKLR